MEFDDFGAWVENIFNDAPLTDVESEPPRVTVAYLTRLFLNATELLQSYSNQQVSEGLSFLASNNHSDTMYALVDESIPWPERQQCIQSMYILFKDFFAHRCSPELSFPPERFLANPLNFVSWHWFDLLPLHGRQELAMEFLDVLRKVLTIDSGICQEGALSGLGSWNIYYPERTGPIFDEFLRNTPKLNPQLREHVALARRSLNVL